MNNTTGPLPGCTAAPAFVLSQAKFQSLTHRRLYTDNGQEQPGSGAKILQKTLSGLYGEILTETREEKSVLETETRDGMGVVVVGSAQESNDILSPHVSAGSAPPSSGPSSRSFRTLATPENPST